MSYTKGPWVLSEVDNVYVHIPHSKLPYYLRVLPEESNVADSEGYANARLIAAAPELVEALESMIAYAKKEKSCRPNNFGQLDQEILDEAEQTLTKAKGGQA